MNETNNIEKEIDEIVNKHWPSDNMMTKNQLKLAIFDAYKSGMEISKSIYKESSKIAEKISKFIELYKL